MSDEPRHPWFEWRDAFAAACARFARECEDQSHSWMLLASYIDLIERLLAAEPEYPPAIDDENQETPNAAP